MKQRPALQGRRRAFAPRRAHDRDRLGRRPQGHLPARHPARLLPVRRLPGAHGDDPVRRGTRRPARARRHRPGRQLRAALRGSTATRAASTRTSTCARSASATCCRGPEARRAPPRIVRAPDERRTPSPRGRGARGNAGRLVARAGIVGAGTLASRVLGLVRDMALAALFDREETDAFFVAFTIPNALRQLLGEGAVSSAVVPVLSEKLAQRGRRRGAGASSPACAACRSSRSRWSTVLGMVFARPLTELFAAGYHERPAEFERTVALTRVVFPYIFFMGTAALGMAALNAKRRFAVAAFAPGLLNVALLVAAFALPGRLLRARARSGPGARGRRARRRRSCRSSRSGRRSARSASRRAALRSLDAGVREVLRRIAPMTLGHRRLLRRPRPLAALPLRARARRAELLLVGDAPLRLPAGHLRHGAVDRGAPVARGARGAAATAASSRRRTRTACASRCSSRSRRASRSSSSASRSWSRSSSAARSTRGPRTRRRAR